MHATLPLIQATELPRIRRRSVDILQVDLGHRRNQSCLHCHVNAGPTRTADITRASGIRVVDRCNLTILEQPGYEDLAGLLAEQLVEVVASLPPKSR